MPACLAAQDATTQPTAQSPLTTRNPRQIVEDTVPSVVALLMDHSLAAQERSDRLRNIMRQRADLPALSRIMLGAASWDGATPAQRDAFVSVFADYMISVYLPLIADYAGQQVRVTDDQPLQRGDHLVTTRVSDQKDGADRQLALIACRLRQGEQGWKVIDVTIEGISVVRIFGAQFRPVLAREGMDGLVRQLRAKVAQSQPASTSHPQVHP